jgi:hypothetical protein
VSQGNYKTLGEAWGWFLFLNLQTTCNSEQTALRPQLTVVVVKHQQLASLQNQRKQSKNKVFGDFLVWRTEIKIEQK